MSQGCDGVKGPRDASLEKIKTNNTNPACKYYCKSVNMQKTRLRLFNFEYLVSSEGSQGLANKT